MKKRFLLLVCLTLYTNSMQCSEWHQKLLPVYPCIASVIALKTATLVEAGSCASGCCTLTGYCCAGFGCACCIATAVVTVYDLKDGKDNFVKEQPRKVN